MQRVGLDGLRQAFHLQGRLPGGVRRRIGQAEGGLDAFQLAGKEGGGDVGQPLRLPGRGDAKSGIGRHPDKSPHGFRLDHLNAGQRPLRLAQPLVVLQAQLNQLPAGNRLAIDQPQLGVRFAGRFCAK